MSLKINLLIPYTMPSLGQTRLHSELAAAKARQDRQQMTALALAYIDAGTADSSSFVADSQQLPPPFQQLAACHAALSADPGMDGATLLAAVATQLGQEAADLQRALHDVAAMQIWNRCWDSVFALAIVPRSDHRLLDALTKTIVMLHLLPQLGEQAEHAAWTPARISHSLAATLLLPATVFPLPA